MNRILVTGATGNVGFEVIRFLFSKDSKSIVVAGVRNVSEAKKKFFEFEHLEFVSFDFEDPGTFEEALKNIDSVFLLRPPHISDVERYFKPLIEKIAKTGIKQVVFLSVQGAEKSKVIPHNKIEKLISDAKIPYIFLRPSYFMQNLTTALLSDIQHKRKIILPAGKAKFNWIDIENIGEASAILLGKFDNYSNRAIELTGYENLSFGEVAHLMNEKINVPVVFENVSPIRFFRIKIQEGMKKGMILVMILLHYLPGFQQEPNISGFYEEITGKKPTFLEEFLSRQWSKFTKT